MDSKEKAQLTRINKIPAFKENMEKLTLGKELTNEEKTYLLSVALLFIKSFEADKRHTPYLEFAYYIFLKYSTTYQDYRPLYDFAINFGFYPIAKDIQEKGLIPEMKLTDELASIKLEEYNHENYIETFEQQKMRLNLLKDDSQNISYVAPTSYGKSSLIIEHIKYNLDQNLKVGIIVPTKSLLVQTYKLVRNAELDRRIITHDEMYREDLSFIGVLTQERALRLLEKNNVHFDILYIDEAHNLFEKDSRSILLSRLIRHNAQKNKDQKVIYLSPLINNSNNLRLDFQSEIVEQKIAHNMKEPEIFEYRENNQILLYNRFVNEFYSYGEIVKKGKEPGYITYITSNRRNKNFIYHKAPRKIEEFSKELFLNLPFIELKRETINLIRELEELVHKDFQMIELLKKGIIYLHGRLPEVIKEYLEYQFKQNTDLNIVIANKVILEGINLPVDNLFIMHSNGLKEKEVTNLIGRVNRLNEVFRIETNQLAKLLPSVHFLNSKYNKKNIKMENLISKLRSNIFSDEIKNPILAEYDITKVKDEISQEKIQFIKENEDLILADSFDELEKLKRIFIKSGLENMLSINDSYLKELQRRIGILKGNKAWIKLEVVDKVNSFYLAGFDKDIISDFEIGRLRLEKARNYYRRHIFARKVNSLRENITETYGYFKKRIAKKETDMYIGPSYGEKPLYTENYQGGNQDVFVDLATKSDADLINLAIIKLKIEDDFINYKLNRLIIVLFELELISEEEYNNVVYGTNDQDKIDLIKTGLSFNLIAKLQKDDQLKNIGLDENNNLIVNVDFLEYKNSLNGFYRFEVDKYL
ncbi:DNA helicase [Bacillus cereus]|uniref:DEAD/DEAH box helicase n=1 Tax=Bacillus cereus TaxID=1396 RepID=UPI000BED8233|nr:DEAD/DEAH box helicase [Bacillus cereus]PEE56867.1 DNA helicase [Bacillus cereus]PFC62498.1 DNA helicase [Bacillus cereus]PFD02782.1 DNA helicase [Bacillus cereus]